MKQDATSHTTGVCFAPKVDCEVSMENDLEDGRRKWWVGTACIGEEYYETDMYKSKEYAVSELIGYLEGLSVLIKKEIENLKGMIK